MVITTARSPRAPGSRYKLLSLPLPEKSIRGQFRGSLAVGRAQRCHGDRSVTDNWAWDSVATKQHGLSNEINDVVLGLISPRRGLSPNSPPKVKERTITHSSGSFPIQPVLEIKFQSLVRANSHRKKKQFTQKNQQWTDKQSQVNTFHLEP